MEANAENDELGSTLDLCPFCGVNRCGARCLSSSTELPALVDNLSFSRVSDSAESQAPPFLSDAVMDINHLLDDEDEEEDLLYTLSKSFQMVDDKDADMDLEATKQHLESLMMHRLHCARPADERRDGASPEAPGGGPVFVSHETGEIALPVCGKTATEAKTPDRGGASPPPHVNSNSAISLVRSIVSQSKRRYQKDGFDLDLTYITPRIIAMGVPAWGAEKYYRNPIDDVELFFERKHGGHYRIYNLCSERQDYDSPKRFQGNFKRFPFNDHSAPCPITLLSDFVKDALAFLEEDEQNVVAVHCKAGKGRTGLMISCLLRSFDPHRFTSADKALRFFGEARTYDGKGVTIPSQIRYAHYYDSVINEFDGTFPSSRPLKLYQIVIDSDIKLSGNVDLYFTVEERGVEKLDSRQVFPNGSVKDSKGCLFVFPDEPVLEGDLLFVFFQRKRLGNEKLFHFWLNTSLCSTHEHLCYAERQLDGRLCKVKEESFCKELAVHVVFVDDFTESSMEAFRESVKAEDSGSVTPRKNNVTSANSLQKTLQRFLSKLFVSPKESQDAESR